MKNIPVNAAVVQDKTIIQAEVLQSNPQGKAVKIKAVKGGKYILAEGEGGVAPENITLKRVGDDLYVALEGTDPDHPQMIIEDFYAMPGELVGKGEDGQWHEYVSTDAQDNHEAGLLLDGESSAHALGANAIGSLDGLSMAPSAFSPALIALGALAALAAAAGLGYLIHHYNKDDNNDNGNGGGGAGGDSGNAVLTPELKDVTDNVGDKTGSIGNGDYTDDTTPTFIGTGTPGDTVELWDGDEKIGETIVDENGNWEFTPETPMEPGEHEIVLIGKDPEGNTSEPSEGFEFIIDITAPGKATLDDVYDDVAPIVGSIQENGVTNDNQPTFSGTGEPNTIIEISANGKVLGEAPVDATGHWTFTPTTAMPDGPYEIILVDIDQAGNRGLPNDPFHFVIDTQAPTKPGNGEGEGGIGDVWDDVAPIEGSVPDQGTTNDAQPDLSGNGLEPGDVVTIIDNGNELGTAIVGEDGSWEFTPDTPLVDGEHEFTVIVTDPAGNSSEPSDPYTIIVDTVAPNKPVITAVIDDQGNDTGALTAGDTTDDARPEIQGTAEAGSLVTIYDGKTVLGSVQADENGNWSFTPSLPLIPGQHDITAVAQDAAGNVSPESDSFDFTLITGGIPTAPAITGIYDDQEAHTGYLQKNGLTNDDRPTIEGTAQPGTLLTVFADGVALGSVTVGNDGRWSFTPDDAHKLTDGLHNITAQSQDAAGTDSAMTGEFPIMVDTTAPDAAKSELLTDDVGAITGEIHDGDITDDSTPLYSGTAEPGATVIIKDNGTEIGTAKVGDDGKWSFTPVPALQDGDHSFSTIVEDAAGNQSAESTPIEFVVDTSKVAVSIDYAFDDVEALTGNLASGSLTNDDTPTLFGKATPHAVVNIYEGTTLLGSATANSKGIWSFTTNSLTEGNHSFTAKAVNADGSESDATAPFVLEIDLTKPDQPEIGEIIDDVGDIQGPVDDGGSTDDDTPTIGGGGLNPGDVVTIIDNGEDIGTAIVGEDGDWSYTPETPLPDGDHEFTVIVTDPAGNSSDPSDPYLVIIDTQAPGKPEIGDINDDVGLIQGPIADGGITDDNTPELSGDQLSEGDIVTIIDNGSEIGTAVVDKDGSWSFTPGTPLADGDHEFTIIVTDPAGNISVPSDPYTVIVDTVAPIKPVITAVIDNQGDDTGALTAGDVTDDARPEIQGTAEAGSLVTIYDGTTAIGSVTADNAGNWSFTPQFPLIPGKHDLTAKSQDAAGNVSPESDAFDFTLITGGIPTAPAITGIYDDQEAHTGYLQKEGVTNDNQPTIEGTAQPGSLLTVFVNGFAYGSVTVGSDGRWSFTPDAIHALADGRYKITAQSTDAAGNLSVMTGVFPIVVDTTAPDAAKSEMLTDDVGAITGEIHDGDITDDSTPLYSGTAEPGATVIIKDNGTEIGTAKVGDDGKWSFTPVPALKDGDHSFSTIVEDAAGNQSAESTPIDFIVDTSKVAVSIDYAFDDVEALTGNLASGSLTNDDTPTLFGKATPHAVVNIYEGTTLLGSATANSKGVWSFTTTTLTDGSHSFTAKAVNADGSESDATAPFVLEIDAAKPDQPEIGEIIDDVGDIQGPVEDGGSTDDGTPTIGGGGLNPGDVVTIIDNGEDIGTAIVGEDGDWSYTPETPLPDGDHEFTVIVTDPAGNSSDPSDPYLVIIDTEAPVKPVITSVIDDQGDVTGPLTAGDTTDDASPEIKGTAEPGSIVTIYDGNTALGTVKADSNGDWSFMPPLPLTPGAHDLTAVAEDAAGNTSEPSDAFDFTLVVGGIPNAPAITGIYDDLEAHTGYLQKNGLTNDDRPTIEGTGHAGTVLTVFADGVALGSVTVGSDGRWSFTPDAVHALNDGLHNITAQSKDSAGNLSAMTGEFPIVVDTTAPDPAKSEMLTDDVGAITGEIHDGDTTDDSTPLYSGTAEPGAIVIIKDNGNEIGTAKVADDGKWSFTPVPPLADGDHSFSTIVEDEAGNQSAESTPIDFTVDTSLVLVSIDYAFDDVEAFTGNLSSGSLTNDDTPTLFGKATAGVVVNIYEGTTLMGSATANSQGVWSFTTNTLSDGSHSFTAKAVNADGSETDATAPFVLEIDQTSPGKPEIVDISDDVGKIQGTVADGHSTDDSTPTLSGDKLNPGDIVTISDRNNVIGSAIVGDDGRWSFTPVTPLLDGQHEFTIIATDPAGNSSVSSDPYTIIVDTEAPVAPKIDYAYDNAGSSTGNVSNGGITDDTTPELHGTAEPGSTVFIEYGRSTDPWAPGGTVIADENGNWSWTPPALDKSTVWEFRASSEDEAGNHSSNSGKFSLTIGEAKSYFWDFAGHSNQGWTISSTYQRDYLHSTYPSLSTFRDDVLAFGTYDDSINWAGTVMSNKIEVVAGQTYNISYMAGSAKPMPVGGDGAYLELIIDGKVVAEGKTGVWKYFYGSFTATTTGVVDIHFKNLSSVGLNGNDFFIDDISVKPKAVKSIADIGSEDVQHDTSDITSYDVSDFIGGKLVVDDVATLYQQPEQIKGSDSIDTLQLQGDNQMLDLSRLTQPMKGVEIIDISGDGKNTLKLSIEDILNNGEKDLFIEDGKTQMLINGDSDDTVELVESLSNTDTSEWVKLDGTVTSGGKTYEVYQHSSLEAELLVQEGIQTNQS
ncbi:Ig-like domain-containing protein [Pantoea sp. GbtcB22]|uniref:Ig-like domain-containing protein n=1 Tax=Pantoea sp. GbtcB22 TaxID=2824767 RepID=UPI001C2F3BDD|nr:Ig-like domain-containing protein [Pantoea sp. GbtcB22]